MPLAKLAEEWLAKSDATAAQKDLIKKAFGMLAKCKGEMKSEQWKSFQKAFGISDDDDDAKKDDAKKLEGLKKSVDESVAKLDEAKELIQKSVGFLDAATPDVKPALDLLAGWVGHKPVHQVIAELPAAARAQIEELRKSADANARELEELRKSADLQAKAERQRVMVSKAIKLPHVPLGTDELGTLMRVVSEADPKQGEALEKLLGTVEGVIAKSALFAEQGTKAHGVGSTWQRVTAMAGELVQKSATSGEVMPMSKAITTVLDLNPDLAKQYDAEKSESTPRPIG